VKQLILHNQTQKIILLYKSQQDAHVTEFYCIWQPLYMFRALLSPIFRSTKNCNNGIW